MIAMSKVVLLLVLQTVLGDTGCKLGTIDLSGMPPAQEVSRIDGDDNRNKYTWVFGFCSSLDDPIESTTVSRPCSGSFYLTGFGSGADCIANFANAPDIRYANPDDHDDGGVELTYTSPKAIAHVLVTCADTKGKSVVAKTWRGGSVKQLPKLGSKGEIQYRILITSSCLCPNSPCNAHIPSSLPPPPPQAVCSKQTPTGLVDLSSLNHAFQFIGTENFGLPNAKNYMYVVGFCNTIDDAPEGFNPCTRASDGFVQQYEINTQLKHAICHHDFAADYTFDTETTPDGRSGVVIRTRDDVANVQTKRRWAEVRIYCDSSVPYVELDDRNAAVPVEDVTNGDGSGVTDVKRYKFAFRSRCACANGCTGASAAAVVPQLDCTIGTASQKIDLSSLKPVVFTAKNKDDQSNLTFTLGFCHPLQKNTVEGPQPCERNPGPGYAQMYTGTKPGSVCVRDYNSAGTLDLTDGGVTITAEDHNIQGTGMDIGRKLVKINITCSPTLEPGVVQPDDTFTQVTDQAKGGDEVTVVTLRSRCACAGALGCANIVVDCTKTPDHPTCPPLSHYDKCKIGTIDMSWMHTAQFDMALLPENKVYRWLVGFCHPARPIQGSSPCPNVAGPGYVQQFETNEQICWKDFAHDWGMAVEGDSVVFTAVSMDSNNRGRRTSKVYVKCNQAMPADGTSSLDPAHPKATIVEPASSSDGQTWLLYLQSRCACPNADCKIWKDPKPESCVTSDGIDLSTLTPSSFQALTTSTAGPAIPTVWKINWCTPRSSPDCAEEPGPGFVQLFLSRNSGGATAGSCLADFNTDFSLSSTASGAKIEASQIPLMSPSDPAHPTGGGRTRVNVLLSCNMSLPKDIVMGPVGDVTNVQNAQNDTVMTIYLSSRCACKNGCGPKSTPSTAPPAPPAIVPVAPLGKQCHLPNGADISKLSQFVMENRPHSDGQDTAVTHEDCTDDSNLYTWTFGFCRAVDLSSVRDSCQQPGYFHMHRKGTCERTFYADPKVESISVDDSGSQTGVSITAWDRSVVGAKPSMAVVTIWCNNSYQSGVSLYRESTVAITAGSIADAFETSYEVQLQSCSACADGCKSSSELAARKQTCVVSTPKHEKIDLSALLPWEGQLGQTFTGELAGLEHDPKLYNWVVGWCNPLTTDNIPEGTPTCLRSGGPGYAMQSNLRRCQKDFGAWSSISYDSTLGNGTGGVVIMAEDRHIQGKGRRNVKINVVCNPNMAPSAKPAAMMPNGVLQSGSPCGDKTHQLTFASLCACPGLPCAPDKLNVPTPPVVVATPDITCKVDNKDFGGMIPFQFRAQTAGLGVVSQNVTVVISFCAKSSRAVEGKDPCDHSDHLRQNGVGNVAGYVLMFSDDRSTCIADNAQAKLDSYGGGVMLTTSDTVRNTNTTVYIVCDAVSRKQMASIDPDSPGVTVTPGPDSSSIAGTQYTIHLRSKCACNNGCSATDAPPKPQRIPACPFVNLPPFQFEAPVSSEKDKKMYMWLVGFCDALDTPVEGASQCSRLPGPGYAQQFDVGADGTCWKDFNSAGKFLVKDANLVVIQAVDGNEDGHTVRTMEIQIRCNASMPMNTVALDKFYVDSVYDSSGTQHDYTMYLQSRCACQSGQGCANAPPPPPSAGAIVPITCTYKSKDVSGLVPFEGQLGQQKIVPGEYANSTYHWRVGWCTPLDPKGHPTPCDKFPGPGFVQQYNVNGWCYKDFNKRITIGPNLRGDGVNISAFDESVASRGVRRLDVLLYCNKAAGGVPVARGDVVVSLIPGMGPDDELYTLEFDSRCACDGLCGSAATSWASLGFMIILLIFVLYCVLGTVLNKLGDRDAPLLESIPHKDFWHAVPGNLLDGFIFAYDRVKLFCVSVLCAKCFGGTSGTSSSGDGYMLVETHEGASDLDENDQLFMDGEEDENF